MSNKNENDIDAKVLWFLDYSKDWDDQQWCGATYYSITQEYQEYKSPNLKIDIDRSDYLPDKMLFLKSLQKEIKETMLLDNISVWTVKALDGMIANKKKSTMPGYGDPFGHIGNAYKQYVKSIFLSCSEEQIINSDFMRAPQSLGFWNHLLSQSIMYTKLDVIRALINKDNGCHIKNLHALIGSSIATSFLRQANRSMNLQLDIEHSLLQSIDVIFENNHLNPSLSFMQIFTKDFIEFGLIKQSNASYYLKSFDSFISKSLFSKAENCPEDVETFFNIMFQSIFANNILPSPETSKRISAREHLLRRFLSNPNLPQKIQQSCAISILNNNKPSPHFLSSIASNFICDDFLFEKVCEYIKSGDLKSSNDLAAYIKDKNPSNLSMINDAFMSFMLSKHENLGSLLSAHQLQSSLENLINKAPSSSKKNKI